MASTVTYCTPRGLNSGQPSASVVAKTSTQLTPQDTSEAFIRMTLAAHAASEKTLSGYKTCADTSSRSLNQVIESNKSLSKELQESQAAIQELKIQLEHKDKSFQEQLSVRDSQISLLEGKITKYEATIAAIVKRCDEIDEFALGPDDDRILVWYMDKNLVFPSHFFVPPDYYKNGWRPFILGPIAEGIKAITKESYSIDENEVTPPRDIRKKFGNFSEFPKIEVKGCTLL